MSQAPGSRGRDASPPAEVSRPGSLAALVDELNARAPSDLGESLGYLRNTWSRLSAERRLTQSLATVPGNAGPLNSHHLAHRALTAMRELSPGYLSRFVSHVDALLWLDEAHAAPAATGPGKAPGPAKAVKRRSTPAPR